MDRDEVRELAIKAKLDLYDKLSDPPIPCFGGTLNQLCYFVSLVEQSVNKRQNEIEQKRALGMSFPY